MSNFHQRSVSLALKTGLLCLLIGTSGSACDQPPEASGPGPVTAVDAGAGADAIAADTDEAVQVVTQAASLAGKSGYVVKVHTCNVRGASTDAVIEMRVDVRDVNWTAYTLQPAWVLDHDRYTDRAQNKTDVYFFPDPMKAYHVEGMSLESIGGSGTPSWCWDRISMTRIEAGVAEWTWVWSGKSWLNAENVNSYIWMSGFTSGHNGEQIPSDVQTPGGFHPETGSVFVSYAYQIPATWSCPEGITLEGIGVGTQFPIGKHTVLVAAELALCEYFTTFSKVSPGPVTFRALQPSAAGPNVLGTKTVSVTAGLQHNVLILPNQFE